MFAQEELSRRSFLKLTTSSLIGAVLWPLSQNMPLFHNAPIERLGRVLYRMELKLKPVYNSQTVSIKKQDAIVPWLRTVVGDHPYRYNQRWVETPEGYLWAGAVQPVYERKQIPVLDLPKTSLGPGMWVEVSVPYAEVQLENKPISPEFRRNIAAGHAIRLYYSQILWVDQVQVDNENKPWYRLVERYGYGDVMWAPAEAFRPLTESEMTPIHPDVEDKWIEVNAAERYQTLSCYEGNAEVFYCRIAAGRKFDPDGTPLENSSTPVGWHTIWRKQVSTHMSGGTTGGGYDLPGIGWTTLFSGTGVAIHSTYWHNNFGGELMSHGCVNARPEDAQWIFRWCNPPVAYDPGDLYSKDATISPTRVHVVEG